MRLSSSTVASASDGSVNSSVGKLSLSSESQTKSLHTNVTRNWALIYSYHPPMKRLLPGLVWTNQMHTVRGGREQHRRGAADFQTY